ncbi:MAG TPA: cobalt ECF transporter T component CbiQ [Verrucomicrobia bacterium]|nr:cobalt ECF transporter T component CbiQ [Verrucomicrobiota bacterium]
MLHLLECHACSDPMRHRHPAEKAYFSAGLLLTCLLLPPPGPLLVLLTVLLAARIWAGIPWRVFIRTLLIPLGFILLGTVPLLISIAFGPDGVSLAWVPEQLPSARHLLLRALGAAACLCFLALTTPVMDWLPLVHRLRVPDVIVELMFVLYRMIFILTERFAAIHTAQDSRLGFHGVRNTFRSAGLTGANLLVFSLKRAQAMERGLVARGYDGQFRGLPPEHPASRKVLVMSTLLCAGLGVAVLLFRRLSL